MLENNKKRNKNSLTHEQFLEKVYELVGNEYIVLSSYISSKEKVLVRHNKCGNEFWVRANHFTCSGSRCKKCSFNGMNAKSHDQFIKQVYDAVGEEYTVLGKYERAHTKIRMRHNKCGNEYSVTPASFLYASRCPECNRKIIGDMKRKKHNDFLNEYRDLVGNEYTIISKYQATHISIRIRHNECGTEFNAMPSIF